MSGLGPEELAGCVSDASVFSRGGRCSWSISVHSVSCGCSVPERLGWVKSKIILKA